MNMKRKVTGHYNKIAWQALLRSSLNSTIRSRENPENLHQAHLSEKANSPRKFSGKILKLVGMLLWIIVGLNLIITILIYKIFFK